MNKFHFLRWQYYCLTRGTRVLYDCYFCRQRQHFYNDMNSTIKQLPLKASRITSTRCPLSSFLCIEYTQQQIKGSTETSNLSCIHFNIRWQVKYGIKTNETVDKQRKYRSNYRTLHPNSLDTVRQAESLQKLIKSDNRSVSKFQKYYTL